MFGAMQLQNAQNSNVWHRPSKARPNAAFMAANPLGLRQLMGRLDARRLKLFMDGKLAKAALSEAKQ